MDLLIPLIKLYTRNVFREFKIEDAYCIQNLFGNDKDTWDEYIEKRWAYVQTEVEKMNNFFQGKYNIQKSNEIKYMMKKWKFIQKKLKTPNSKEEMIKHLKNVWTINDVGGWYEGAKVEKDYKVCPKCCCPRFMGELFLCCKGSKTAVNESLIIEEE